MTKSSNDHKVKSFPLRIPPKLKAELNSIAERDERTLTEVILNALREYVDHEY